MDIILARIEIGDQVKTVVIGIADEIIGSGATGDAVIAPPGLDAVVAGIARDTVVTVATKDGVVSGIASKAVVARQHRHGIGVHRAAKAVRVRRSSQYCDEINP